VVVKDGANGAWYYSDSHVQHHMPSVFVEKIVNATGAGDSFNAGFMSAIGREYALSEAIRYACDVGAAKVSGQSIPIL
ncbi:MAG: PfkB family carbohydrate kinase, partial [Candidatus Saccharimonadales bacterium]